VRAYSYVALAQLVRKDVVRMTSLAGTSHVGSALSCTDILSVLYASVMQHRPSEPGWTERDRLVLSKGHAAAALYAVLAEVGYFPVQALDSYCVDGSPLAGHVTAGVIPGVDYSTGSLGHGPSVACGLALGARFRGQQFHTYCVISDGECQEGSVWEAALFGAHHGLDNLTLIVDFNGLQGLGRTDAIMSVQPLIDKWIAFGWDAVEVDGHDGDQLKEVLLRRSTSSKPKVIIARTIKGFGVEFMEDQLEWHYRSVPASELAAVLRQMDN
jgi:transketolase